MAAVRVRKTRVRRMRHISDADTEADSLTGSIAEAALIVLLRGDRVDRANPRVSRKSAGEKNGSPLCEVSAPLLSVEQNPRLGRVGEAARVPKTHPLPRGCKPQINVMRPGGDVSRQGHRRAPFRRPVGLSDR
jgi:hypothetical protein